jgi:hypothetical protein
VLLANSSGWLLKSSSKVEPDNIVYTQLSVL